VLEEVADAAQACRMRPFRHAERLETDLLGDAGAIVPRILRPARDTFTGAGFPASASGISARAAAATHRDVLNLARNPRYSP